MIHLLQEIGENNKSSGDKYRKRCGAIVDSSGNIVYPAMHRKDVGRIVLKYNVYKTGSTDRYYYETSKDFNKALKQYNKASQQTGKKCHYSSCGLANTRVRFCSKCFDVGKNENVDTYFIDRLEKASKRTILCYGCIGSVIRAANESVAKS